MAANRFYYDSELRFWERALIRVGCEPLIALRRATKASSRAEWFHRMSLKYLHDPSKHTASLGRVIEAYGDMRQARFRYEIWARSGINNLLAVLYAPLIVANRILPALDIYLDARDDLRAAGLPFLAYQRALWKLRIDIALGEADAHNGGLLGEMLWHLLPRRVRNLFERIIMLVGG